MNLPRYNIHRLQNRILLMLFAAGPRTNEELALLLNNRPSSVRGANSTNIALGLVTMTRRRGCKPVFSITPEGNARVNSFPPHDPRSTEKLPHNRAAPVKEKVIAAMRTGLKATDWARVTTTRNRLYILVDELRRLGYVISKTKQGKFVTYTLVSEPSKKGNPNASSLHPDRIRP
jgi:hypothetical protein